jgi:hypothetical protein
VAVAADVPVLGADHEHDEILVAARDAARGRRLDVGDSAGLELEGLARDLEPRPATVDEVELVLIVVEVGRLTTPGASTSALTKKAVTPSSRRILRNTPSPVSSIEPYEYATNETWP